MIQVHLSGAALRQLGKIREAQVLIDNWRVEYNTFRPHMSLGCQPPAPEAVLPQNTVGCLPGLLRKKV